MDILTCAPNNCSFSQVQCCVCKKVMNIYDRGQYTVTKSNRFLCMDCIEKGITLLKQQPMYPSGEITNRG